MKWTFLIFCTAGLSAWGACFGQGASLKGQFIYDGKPPAPKELTGKSGPSEKDKADCGDPKLKVMDETLVVDPKSKGIANVAVYLSVPMGGVSPPSPEGNVKLKAVDLVFDNKWLRFEPRMVVAQTGQKVNITNSDKVGHNTKVDFFVNPPFNETIPSGGKLTKVFDKEERLPAPVSCTIHPFMQARILVRDNPYFAVTDKEGKFEIKDLPDGEWQFTAYQEKAGYLSKVKVGGKEVTWNKGKFNQKFSGKEVDLGRILVSEKNFEGK